MEFNFPLPLYRFFRPREAGKKSLVFRVIEKIQQSIFNKI
jgi:hypothetical protein